MKRTATPLLLSGLLVLSACGDDAETPAAAATLPPVGTVWAVDIQSGQWVVPANAGGIVDIVAGEYPFFVGIHGVAGTTADLLLAVSEGGSQQLCNKTVVMYGLQFADDQHFKFGPTDFTIANGMTTQQLEFSGTIRPDGTFIEEIEMKGHIVVDSIPEDILTIPREEACDTLGLAEIECVPCPVGGGNCVAAHVVGMRATLSSGINLQVIDQSDCHSGCAATADNADCTAPAGP